MAGFASSCNSTAAPFQATVTRFLLVEKREARDWARAHPDVSRDEAGSAVDTEPEI